MKCRGYPNLGLVALLPWLKKGVDRFDPAAELERAGPGKMQPADLLF